jgi:hypothetical protein
MQLAGTLAHTYLVVPATRQGGMMHGRWHDHESHTHACASCSVLHDCAAGVISLQRGWARLARHAAGRGMNACHADTVMLHDWCMVAEYL